VTSAEAGTDVAVRTVADVGDRVVVGVGIAEDATGCECDELDSLGTALAGGAGRVDDARRATAGGAVTDVRSAGGAASLTACSCL